MKGQRALSRFRPREEALALPRRGAFGGDMYLVRCEQTAHCAFECFDTQAGGFGFFCKHARRVGCAWSRAHTALLLVEAFEQRQENVVGLGLSREFLE